ncbi:MAG: hypothetical protein VX777_01535 [Chlamydiota bacterium]|nr:hypothetical protein [Chlamydiota bacterium]
MVANTELSAHLSPNDKFKNYVGNLIDSDELIKSVVLARLVSLIAGSAIALVALGYHSMMLAMKMPITMLRVAIVFIPFVNRKNLASKLPGETQISTQCVHLLKIVFCVADIFLYPTIGTAIPRLHRFVSKVSFLYHYEGEIKPPSPIETLPPPPPILFQPTETPPLKKLRAEAPQSVMSSLFEKSDFQKVRTKITKGCRSKLDEIEASVMKKTTNTSYEFSSLKEIAATFALRIQINAYRVEYDFGKDDDWKITEFQEVAIPTHPSFYQPTRPLTFESCSKDDYENLKNFMRSNPDIFGRILTEKLLTPITFDPSNNQYTQRSFTNNMKVEYLKNLFTKELILGKTADEIYEDFHITDESYKRLIQTAHSKFHAERFNETCDAGKKQNASQSIIGKFLLQKQITDTIDNLTEKARVEFLEDLKDGMASIEEFFEELEIDESDKEKQQKCISKLFGPMLIGKKDCKTLVIEQIIKEYSLAENTKPYNINKLLTTAFENVNNRSKDIKPISRESFNPGLRPNPVARLS